MIRIRRLLKKFLFTALTFIFLLVVLELVLRVTDPEAVQLIRGTREVFGSLSYPAPLQSNANVSFRNFWRDGEATQFTVRTDERGHRLPTTEESTSRYQAATSGENIVYCVGDSFTFGWGVDDEESYPSLLQNLLGSRYRVLNLGTPGWGLVSVQEECKLMSETITPDAIVYLFYFNDFEDDDRLMKHRRSGLQSQSSWLGGLVDRASRHLSLAPFFMSVAYIPAWTGFDRPTAEQRLQPLQADLISRLVLLSGPGTPFDRDRPSFTALRALREECDANGIRLITAALMDLDPNLFQFVVGCIDADLEVVPIVTDNVSRVPDSHFNRAGNSMIASQIQAQLMRFQRERQHWTPTGNMDESIECSYPQDRPNVIELKRRPEENTQAEPSSQAAGLRSDGYSLSAGHRYVLEFGLGSSSPADWQLSVLDVHDPRRAIFATRIPPQAKTRVHRISFHVPFDCQDAFIQIETKQAPNESVFSNISLLCEGRQVPFAKDATAQRPEEDVLYGYNCGRPFLTWQLRSPRPTAAELSFGIGANDACRVSELEACDNDPWSIGLVGPSMPVLEGMRFLIEFQARADQERDALITFSQNHSPWDNAGLYELFELTTDWKTFRWEFETRCHDPACCISFFLGASPVPLEFAGFRISRIAPDPPAPPTPE